LREGDQLLSREEPTAFSLDDVLLGIPEVVRPDALDGVSGEVRVSLHLCWVARPVESDKAALFERPNV